MKRDAKEIVPGARITVCRDIEKSQITNQARRL
jgi:hypothetical protein